MRRREVLILLSATIGSRPLRAEPVDVVVAVLSSGSPGPHARHAASFARALDEVGLIDGKNVRIEYHWAEGNYDRLPALATELAKRRVTLIAAMTVPAALAAKAATTAIPIVFYVGVDPVEAGLVSGFARPGGNLTGISSLNALLNSKRLELLRQIVPDIERIGLLINPDNVNADALSKETIEAAREINTQIVILKARNQEDLSRVFLDGSIKGLVVGADPFFNSSRDYLTNLAAKYHIPTIYPDREYVVAGGLISYAYNLVSAWYQVGVYAGKILHGAKPEDLPVQQPTTLQLVINLQTAKTLGIAMPRILLVQADEVIE